jgi:aminopeptidase N
MIKTYTLGLIASISCIFNFTFSQCPIKTLPYDVVSIPKEHNIDVERMRLEVNFKPEKGLVEGKVTHFFTPLRDKVDSIFFDGIGILIKKVTLNGREIQFKTAEAGFTFYPGKSLSWGEKDSITIQYEATPKKGIYFIGWNDTRNLSRKQIWTQGQAFDNRHWIPCFDLANDKLISEVIVHFDSDYKVLSNGNKISEKKNPDNTTTWHYKITNPHPTYLVMLGIGKYEIRNESSSSGVPMYQWYYPEWKNRLDATYKYSKKIFDFLESEIRIPYPWESYAQIPVQDFMYGAMENTTATIFGDFFHVDNLSFNDGNYVGVNAHELAHQWFGDLVTARTVTHLWLQESFATHYNLLAERECFGIDHFDWARRQATNAALNTMDKKPLAFSDISTSIVYQKGSQVLEMLKHVIGREAYNRGIKRYLTDHKYANVDSEDLLNAFHDELGLSLEWLWDEWIYKGGEPAYKIEYKEVKTADNNKFTEIIVNQTQANNDPNALFKMPIEFEVFYKDGTSDKQTTWIEKQTHIVSIPNPGNKKIDFVLFDPNSRILKTVNFTKSFEELSAQAEKAPNMLDRYDAVVALKGTSIKNKIALFEKLYDQNSFYSIKAEIVNQLIDDTSERSLNLIKKSLEDKDIKVRKEIATITKTIHPSLESAYVKLLQDSSYLLIGTAIEKLYQNFPEKADNYLALTKDIEGTNGRNVRIKWLRMAYNHKHKQEYLDQLVDYTSGSYEFLTRVNAMTVLRRINYFNEQLLNNCIDAATKSNSRLANPAKEAITYYYNQDANKTLIKNTINTLQTDKATKDMLRKLAM